jgi:hypothetical protein
LKLSLVLVVTLLLHFLFILLSVFHLVL